MALQITHRDDAEVESGFAGPPAAARVRWSRRLSPAEFPLRLTLVELVPGGALEWTGEHADEGIYVLTGALGVAGTVCPAGGALVLEAGIPAVAHAPGPTQFLHVRPSAVTHGTGKQRAGRCVHVVTSDGWFHSGDRENVEATWFADSSCPTCEIALFRVHKEPADPTTGPAHSHSADEIIYVLDGAVRLGRREYGAGTSLCIPADQRYTLSASEQGYTFLNYRPRKSEQTYYPRNAPTRVEPEGGLARGGILVGAVTDVTA